MAVCNASGWDPTLPTEAVGCGPTRRGSDIVSDTSANLRSRPKGVKTYFQRRFGVGTALHQADVTHAFPSPGLWPPSPHPMGRGNRGLDRVVVPKVRPRE